MQSLSQSADILDLDQFIQKYTAGYDASHDFSHAKRVQKLACKIAAYEGIHAWQREWWIIYYAAGVHDLLDHKYTAEREASSEKLTREMLEDYLIRKLSADSAAIILAICDNVSWSREIRGKLTDLGIYQPLRDIVSDADKIDALGAVGWQRCIDFTRARGGRVPEDVVQHCQEKLLRLKDEFIRTKAGKMLAREPHKEIAEYVRKAMDTDPIV